MRVRILPAVVVLCCCVIAQGVTVMAQNKPDGKPEQKPTPKPDKKEQPLELPEFVITGVEAIDVPGGAKQAPTRSPRLTQDELDRFNPLEKQALKTLPAPPLPTQALAKQQFAGFVRGEFGMFTTPAVDAGYHATWQDFDLYARAHGMFSGGHLPRAGFTDVGASLNARYIAADKFFFFGGSKTDSYVRVRHRSYQLYGSEGGRSSYNYAPLEFGGGVRTTGAFESLLYDMGASFEQTTLLFPDSPLDYSLFRGHLGMAGNVGAITLGGRVNLDLQSVERFWFAKQNLYFLQAVATAEYRSPAMTKTILQSTPNEYSSVFVVNVEAGAQSARNSAEEQLTGFAASLRAQLYAAPWLTLRANARTGYEPNSFQAMLQQNPYLMPPDESTIDYTRSLYDVSLQAVFQTMSVLSISVKGRLRDMKQYQIIKHYYPLDPTPSVSSFMFASYINAFIVSGEAELLWNPSSADAITLNAALNQGRRTDNFLYTRAGVPIVPYLPTLQASASYRRMWTDALSTRLSASYTSDRYVAVTDTEGRIPAFLDLALQVDYAFTNRLSVYVRGENLLNQQIFLWEGYRERGLYVAGGVAFKF